MAKWQAEIVGPWVVDPDGQRSKKLSREYVGLFISDITGQPGKNLIPDPNLVSVLVTCEATALEQIETDGAYFILWAEEIEKEVLYA